MGAFVLPKIPYSYVTASITCNKFSLVRMNYNIVDWMIVVVVALYTSSSSVPDLHRSVLRACDHPFPFTVKRCARDIPAVAIKCQDRCRVRGANVVKLDVMVACCCEPALIWGYAQSVDLRVGMLNRTRADARQSFPESDRMIVASCTENHGHIGAGLTSYRSMLQRGIADLSGAIASGSNEKPSVVHMVELHI